MSRLSTKQRRSAVRRRAKYRRAQTLRWVVSWCEVMPFAAAIFKAALDERAPKAKEDGR